MNNNLTTYIIDPIKDIHYVNGVKVLYNEINGRPELLIGAIDRLGISYIDHAIGGPIKIDSLEDYQIKYSFIYRNLLLCNEKYLIYKVSDVWAIKDKDVDQAYMIKLKWPSDILGKIEIHY